MSNRIEVFYAYAPADQSWVQELEKHARTDFPTIWNVPFPQNLFFIGREDLLAQLHDQLQQGRTAALSQALRFSCEISIL